MKTALSLFFALGLTALLTACASDYKSTEGMDERSYLELRADQTLASFRVMDPSMKLFIDHAYGYAVFPQVTKGGFVVGAAHGHGVLYEGGTITGYAEVTQVNVGAQVGGQSYSQVIFFQTQNELMRFKREELKFNAQASMVAAAAGTAANADYADGVAIFTMGNEGLMLEAAIGGQTFKYHPKSMSMAMR